MSEIREIVCPACSAVNKVPADKPALKAKCGSCSRPLFNGRPLDANAARFEKQIKRSSVPVVVDVWAPWCGPCRTMAPAFEQAARDMEPDVRFMKLNSDDQQDVAARLGIRGIPTMILYKDGREVARQSGAMSASQIKTWISQKL